ncbi:hypothetical protein [Gordonia sp. VNK21]|uniref:hypothetical protein n=1 Tax=Gordonia sp. VNK21 TaxID=3382483 RepID=UPI0038D40F0E
MTDPADTGAPPDRPAPAPPRWKHTTEVWNAVAVVAGAVVAIVCLASAAGRSWFVDLGSWLSRQPSEAWSGERVALGVLIFVSCVRVFGSWFSKGSVRRVRWRAWRTGINSSCPCRHCRGMVYRTLRRALTQVQHGAPPPPARVAAVMFEQHCPPWKQKMPGVRCACTADFSPDALPFETRRFGFAAQVVREAVEPRSSTMVGRYLLSDRTTVNTEYLALLNDYLQQFAELVPVRQETWASAKRAWPSDREGQPDHVFRESISALTGAVVLADATATRAACFDRIVVWHRGLWCGATGQAGSSAPAPTLEQSAYDAVHEREHGAAGDTGGFGLLGDYNGRIPVLDYVDARQHPGAEGATLVLVTDETDYYSTEPGKTADAGGFATHCKKLSDAQLTHDARHDVGGFALLPAATVDAGPGRGRTLRPIGARRTPGERRLRAPLLNGKVCLIAESAGGPYLVLMQRSNNVSNAPGVLGPTSGGVVELKVGPSDCDEGRFGTVEILDGIRRELTEELGLQPDDYELEASCVFESNSAPEPVGDAGTKGEILTTLLATGRTALTPDDFRRRRIHASPGKGRYESVGLLFVPVGPTAESFAEALTTLCHVRGRQRPRKAGTRRILDDLEQSALVGALYCCAMLHGPAATVAAFRRAFATRPWWAVPWQAGTPRIVVDPDRVIRDSGNPPEAIFAQWVRELYSAAPESVGPAAGTSGYDDLIAGAGVTPARDTGDAHRAPVTSGANREGADR